MKFKLLFVLAVLLVPVLAVHTSNVATSPESAGGSREVEFTFNITNNGRDSISEVRVRIPLEFSALKCGTAPSGWSLAYSDAVECNYKTVSAYISADGTVPFTVKTTTASRDGNYTWEVRTRDIFDGFSLHNPVTPIDGTAPTILTTTLKVPNGGEKWETGSRHDILWSSKDITDSNLADNPIALEYNTDGNAWVLIAKDEENDGALTWTAPAAAESVRVRITARDRTGNTASDESDSPFTITPSAPTVTIRVGESKTLDVNKDGRNDTTITVKSVLSDGAVLIVDPVAGGVPAPSPAPAATVAPSPKPSPAPADRGILSNPTVTAIVVILILIILYLIWRLQQLEKKKK